MLRIFRAVALPLMVTLAVAASFAAEAPKLVSNNGRWALMVDGQPYLILGGQIHNSSSWPSELPQVWQSLESLHANTIEAPVYWEQMEPQPGQFDWTNVDALVKGARAHNLHVVVLWFGTWKNGNMHYVPGWIKTNPQKYPRVIRDDGQPIDVLSPNSRTNLEADKAAFVQLMSHLKAIDSSEHTVLMIQVENEAGNIGSVRDFSPHANEEFQQNVPADLLTAANKQPGTWEQVFGANADEIFQLYYQAHYINEIAGAGRKEFNIPMYVNVWLSYPPAELPQRAMLLPGIQYPSGGVVQRYVELWHKLVSNIDFAAPDIYGDDPGFVESVLDAYAQPDNALSVPEIAKGDSFAKYLFLALGKGTIAFSPFGIDSHGWNILGNEPPTAHSRNFALLEPMSREIAKLNFEGKLKTAVEEPGQTEQEVDFGKWQATVAFGFPQYDGRRPPGTKDAHGAALIAQLGPDEFLVTGVDASVNFHLPGKLPWVRSEILSAQQGTYKNGVWVPSRLWNGDETDRGLQFPESEPAIVRIKLNKF